MSFLSQLTEIHFQWCSGVSDEGVSALVLACPLLTTIDLMSCSITNKSIEAIAKGFGDLRHLDVSWCSSLTDAGIQALAPAHLRTARASLIAAAFAELPAAAAAAHRPNEPDPTEEDTLVMEGDEKSLLGARRLQTLCVVWCSGITDGAITALATLPCLQVVEASGCSGVTAGVVGVMRSHGIRVVH
jgi:bacterioferritin-associated ferredoxin